MTVVNLSSIDEAIKLSELGELAERFRKNLQYNEPLSISDAVIDLGALSTLYMGRQSDQTPQIMQVHFHRTRFVGECLEGAIFNSCTFSHCSLDDTRFHKVIFRDVTFSFCSFCRAILIQSSFEGSQLISTSFNIAVLRDTGWDNVKDLHSVQFAGADLTGAKLPSEIAKFAALAHVEQTARAAQRILAAMVLGCAYSALTSAVTTDAALLTNSVNLELPIIRTAIPILWFYVATPVLLSLIFIYFHLYAQRLWEGLAELPAIFPDGRSLDKRAYPWLFTGLVNAYFPILRHQRPSYSRLQNLATLGLGWLAVPAAGIIMWLRVFVVPSFFLSVLLACLVAPLACLSYSFFSTARRTLKEQQPVSRSSYDFSRQLQRRTSEPETPEPSLVQVIAKDLRKSYRGIICCLAATGLLVVLSVLPFKFRTFDVQGTNLSGKDLRGKDFVRAKMMKCNLAGANLFQGTLDSANLGLADLTGANLSAAKLRDAYLVGAALGSADLAFADLRGAVLLGAKLRGANLLGVVLDGAGLSHADLTGAILHRAKLSGARLAFAVLDSADLTLANLTGAGLRNATLRRATLWDAELDSAILTHADLTGADLHGASQRGAVLDSANLSNAQMTGARLIGASLRGANLFQTTLDGADLTSADLSGARLNGATFRGANMTGTVLDMAEISDGDLGGAQGLTVDQLCSAQRLFRVDMDSVLLRAILEKCPNVLSKNAP